ncbi:MAG: diguanylate cyclase [Thermodesulfovibrionales bacterium]|nr:diguanylate cyclase [Thermodesulfovibrionales bacterium]
MFKYISIKSKLIILLSSSAALALIISSTITLYSTFTEQKKQSLMVLHQITDIISENMRAALAFHDDASIMRLLLPFKNNQQILIATVKNEHDTIVGMYNRENLTKKEIDFYIKLISDKTLLPFKILKDKVPVIEDIKIDYMYIIQPIYFQDAFIGSISIVYDNSEFREKMGKHIMFQFIVSILSLSIIFLLSITLQKIFTDPIVTLINTMQDISNTKDFSKKIISERKDEFDELNNQFNIMIGEIRQRDEQLTNLAVTDSLTGLNNRRNAMEKMRDMTNRALRKKEYLGIILFDIDHFKKINDTYGHLVGDMVLKEIASLLLNCARDYDIAARIGGEEFLLLCDNSDCAATLSIAERIRHRVENHNFICDDNCLFKVTVSIGAYALITDNVNIEQIYKVADDALYKAKRKGRNCVVMADCV